MFRNLLLSPNTRVNPVASSRRRAKNELKLSASYEPTGPFPGRLVRTSCYSGGKRHSIRILRATTLELALCGTALAAPVTTEGTGVGKHGDVTVAVTFDGGKITAIDVKSSLENPILAKGVFTDMKDAMVRYNSADVDVVAGATLSSEALRTAVKAAAEKAGVTLAGPVVVAKRAPKVPEKNVYDVVVVGSGGAGFSAAITAHDAGASVVILEKMPTVGGNSLIPKGATGSEFISKFMTAAEKRKIPIVTGMKAEELLRDADGRVTGVRAVMDGKDYVFEARRGTVLATGGFAANVDMRTKANPFYGAGFKTTNMPGAQGDGIVMAEKIGAAVANMDQIQTYPMCDPVSGAIELIDDARFEGAILINQEGRRFVEELERRDVMSKAILAQTGQYCYALFNQKVEDRAHAVQNHQDEVAVFSRTGILYKGETLKDVADHFKIPVDALEDTVKKVSSYAKTGKDLDFNYRGKYEDLTTGPYWIYRGVPSVHHTMGGLRINPKAQVLDAKGNPIPGLWAAGEVTGVTHGSNRLGSNAYADIIVFGRIAGEEAAKAVAK